ncbi:MAG: leucyl aminopeptidase [Vicinamibacterales bacterium]
MASVHQPVVVRVSGEDPATATVDAWIVPVFETDDLAGAPGLDAAAGDELQAARARGEFSGKAFETLVCRLNGWRARYAVVVGAGARAGWGTTVARRVATVGALAVRARRLSSAGVLCRAADPAQAAPLAQAMVEGVSQANYDGGALKTAGRPPAWIAELLVHGTDTAVRAAAEAGAVVGEATNQARAMVNDPGNLLTPRVFAERAARLAGEAGLGVEILDEAAIAGLKMGLLQGVARGSKEPPRVIVLRHEPAGLAAGPVLACVGKGITFDSGGISIKPSENMDKMKGDMAGGAAVVGALCAIARLKLPVRVIGIVPATENLPGGNAMKPGDVLTSAEGKTVEVLNTDAEGRLILGDGVWYARRLGATHLVDVATLTGACMIALGKTTTGLFASPDTWADAVLVASDRAGERTWKMPVYDDYRDLFKSDVADFSNTGGRYGGAITAALFIKEFAGDLPWAHLDIAGPAWAEEARPFQPKGATGAAVRTLVEVARAMGAGTAV